MRLRRRLELHVFCAEGDVIVKKRVLYPIVQLQSLFTLMIKIQMLLAITITYSNQKI